MKLFTLFILILLGYGCSTNKIKEDLNKADTITIHFFKNSLPDSVLKIVRTTNTVTINKLATFIAYKEIKEMPCVVDGDIEFFKADHILALVRFNTLNGSCRQFIFDYNGRHYATRVGNEVADLLTALWAGKSFY
ncbi:MAG: hypothetical protein NVS1B13_04280 [Flavisolibacter sp.]